MRATSLRRRFRQQSTFTNNYAPLYHRLLTCLAGWLAADHADPPVGWLLTVAGQHVSVDVTLLLAAGLHRAVLAGVPAVHPVDLGCVPA